MTKRFSQILFFVCACVTVLTVNVMADRDDVIPYAVTGGNIYFDTEQKSITDCDETVTNAVIPVAIEGMKVTSIGWNAFVGCTSLESVTVSNSVTSIWRGVFSGCTSLVNIDVASENLNYSSMDGVLFDKAQKTLICYPAGKQKTTYYIPDSVTSIESGAFSGCTGLENVSISNSVTSIESGAFSGCTSLKSVSIPDSVTSIGNSAFNACRSLEDVTIPDSVVTIGRYAFSSCTSLESVNIPNSVAEISNSAFSYCEKLAEIVVADENQNYSSSDGVLFDKEQETLVVYPVGHGSVYVIPDNVIRIGDRAFSYCHSLASVTIPDSVTIIGERAFENCTRLTSVIMGDGVTTIGNDAFFACHSLASVTIPDSVTTIGGGAFTSYGGLTNISVSVNNSAYSSVSGILFNKNQTELICYPAGLENTAYVIPESVTAIGNDAFCACRSLTSVMIPDNVTKISDRAFSYCSGLSRLTIPDSVTTIGNDVLYECPNVVVRVYENSYAHTYAVENNIPFELMNGEPEPSNAVSVGAAQTMSVTGDTYTFTLDCSGLNPDAGVSCQVWYGLYDVNGKMLSLNAATLPENGKIELTVEDVRAGRQCRIFLLDGEFSPQCGVTRLTFVR